MMCSCFHRRGIANDNVHCLYYDNHVSHAFLADRLNTFHWYPGHDVTVMRNSSHDIMANSPSYSMMGSSVPTYLASPLVYI